MNSYYHIHYQVGLNAGRYNGLPLVRRQCPLNRFVPNAYFSPPFKCCKQQIVSPENFMSYNALCFNIFLLLIFKTNNRFLASFDSSRDDLKGTIMTLS